MDSYNQYSAPLSPKLFECDRSPFLHELHCIGSLPAVLTHFNETTGWHLTYHCADSVPYFLRNCEEDGKPVSLKEKKGCTTLPSKLSPKILEEIASEEDVWIPIEIKSDFHALLHLPISDLDEIFSEQTDETCKSLDFLNYPIGFLHLSHVPSHQELQNPTSAPFHAGKLTPAHVEVGKNLYPKREVSFSEAYRSASAIRDLLAEMQVMRVHLWLLEIDVAVNSLRLEENTPLGNAEFAGRFSQLLEYVCKALKMKAIGIYIFDPKKEVFKLRIFTGLPADSPTQSVRSMGEAQADWRAFHQNQVFVLDEQTLSPNSPFLIPEGFPAGICCPLETKRSLLGSIWFFSDKRVIPEETVPLAEIMAELFAVTVEQEAFFRRYGHSIEYRTKVKEASLIQQIQKPIQVPKMCRFDLDGMVRPAQSTRNRYSRLGKEKRLQREEAVCGDFYDWVKLKNGQMLVALGSVGVAGLPGAMLASSVRATLRSHARHCILVTEILEEVHYTLWHLLAGNAQISLFCGVLNPEGNYLAVHFAHAGGFRGLKIGRAGVYESVPLNPADCWQFLGGSTEFHCFEDSLYLKPEHAFVVFNDGLSPSCRDEKLRAHSLWLDEMESEESDCELLHDLRHGGRGEDGSCLRTGTRRMVLTEREKLQQLVINQELGTLLSGETNSKARLMTSQVRNYFSRHVAIPGRDQSALVMRYGCVR